IGTGKPACKLEEADEPWTDASFAPCGTKIAATVGKQWVRIWDLKTGKVSRRIDLTQTNKGVTFVTFTPDGKGLGSGEGSLRVHCWDLHTGKPLFFMDPEPKRWEMFSVASDRWRGRFAPDGRTLFTASPGTCLVWDMLRRCETDPLPRASTRESDGVGS